LGFLKCLIIVFLFPSKKLRCKNKQINIDYQENPIDILAYFNKFVPNIAFYFRNYVYSLNISKKSPRKKRFCNLPNFFNQASCKFVFELEPLKLDDSSQIFIYFCAFLKKHLTIYEITFRWLYYC